MNDEQCRAIIHVIRELIDAIQECSTQISDSIDGIGDCSNSGIENCLDDLTKTIRDSSGRY